MAEQDTSNQIAVIGMSGRFPDCDTLDELWDLLQQGRDVHQEIPSTRFNIDDFYDPSGERKNSVLTRYGCFLKNPGLFDNYFFNISPREAAQMDPLQRIFLMTTYEALEMAGYSPDSAMLDKSRISTYFGQSTDDWRTINDQQGIQAHYLPATNRSFAPGRVNHWFKWGGGHYSIDTGCSSSATAIHLACSALLARECDMSVVGGGNICVIPEYFSGFSLGSFLSQTGSCKTFSDDADGYCRGEAVGTVVLKRLDDAVAANDNILGVIAATARNTNAGEGPITYPGQDAQVALLEKLLARSGMHADEIGFVEMHGTGTRAGDLVEMNSIRTVFERTQAEPLYVGALKASIGHGEAAAGISSLIKALLMFQNDDIPPQPGPYNLSRTFRDIEAAGIHIPDGKGSSIPFSKVDGRWKVIVNSFDAAGGNTSILLQEPRGPLGIHLKPRSHHVVVFSARSIQSLEQNRDRLRQYLDTHDVRLDDLSYTTTARRMHHTYRETYVVESVAQLITQLKGPPPEQPVRRSPVPDPSLMFVFTGQSSQYTGMGAMLYRTSPRFKRTVDSYEDLCTTRGLASFVGIIEGTVDIASASTRQVQLAIVALEIALAQFLQEVGLKPTLVMGHSLGEYSALCVAGVLSISDTLYLIDQRSALLEKHCVAGSHGMMAIPLAAKVVRMALDAIQSPCKITCLNGPSSTVIGGPLDMLEVFKTKMTKGGLKVIQLNVPYAFHSAQMIPMLYDYKKVCATITFGLPRIPIVSTKTGALLESTQSLNPLYLVQQAVEPVDFLGAARTCEREGLIDARSLVIEVGPHPVCSDLLTLCLPNISLAVLPTLQRGRSDWEMILNCLAAAYAKHHTVDWELFHADRVKFLRVLHLPTYAFNTTNYWTSYQRQACDTPAESHWKHAGFAGSSAALQIIEDISDDKLSATFTSRTAEPTLLRTIQGHTVDGAAICPASLFIDIAAGAAQALLHTTSSRTVEIADLKMMTPLTVSKHYTEQKVQVKARADPKTSSVAVQINSLSRGVSAEHAVCEAFLHGEWRLDMSIWPQVKSLVQRRVEALSNPSSGDSCHRMGKGIMYKLFDSIVEYSTPFRILDNIIVDKDFQDAVAELRSPASTEQGSFTLDPFAVDALIHLPGFLLNCNLEKAKDEIHIAKSIGRVVLLDHFFTRTHPVTFYATITGKGDDGTTLCDAYAFSDGNLAALASNICFQKISRTTFNMITDSPVLTHLAQNRQQHRSPANSETAFSDKVAAQTARRPPLDRGSLYSLFLRTVATTTGVDIDTVRSAGSFTEIGVDSHMGMAIIAEVNRTAGIVLPAAFFNNFPTLTQAEQELRGDDRNKTAANVSEGSERSNLTPTSTVSLSSRSHGDLDEATKNQSSLHTETQHTEEVDSQTLGKAILLQGKANSTTTPLFLVSESSGSVAVYTHFPPLPDGTRIYGLESPFAHRPQDNTLSVADLAKAHIATMRNVQPNGPYLLGGYSFACVYAYEMAYQLALLGERLLGLVLIDMYVPPPAEIGMKRFSLDGIGAGPLANITMRISSLFPRFTENQKLHMAASMQSAVSYTPAPIPLGVVPYQTHLVWASKGVNENSNPEEHDDTLIGPAWMGGSTKPWAELTEPEFATMLKSWFFSPRETFGTNGWEKLVGGNITIHKVDADHLSMVAPPQVQKLGQTIARAVQSCTQ